jgi:hypothetical protein
MNKNTVNRKVEIISNIIDCLLIYIFWRFIPKNTDGFVLFSIYIYSRYGTESILSKIIDYCVKVSGVWRK